MFAVLALVCLAAGPEAVVVEPSVLAKRADLIGREVVVDDRVAYFQFHKERDFDEVVLKRTPVVFRLPLRLRFKQPPRPATARVRGVLRREGDQVVCDVTELELLPDDLVRLDRGVAALPADEFGRRSQWAQWAQRRGNEFQDKALTSRGRALEDEAIRIEADRPSADPPARWLALARRARVQKLDEPAPSALAHRAFVARLASARQVDDLKSLVADIESFLPDASKRPPVGVDATSWLAAYAENPASAYRAAPEPARAALDHRLWADATQRLLEAEAADKPENALALADQADARLPDRPEVAARLLDRGLKTATRDLGALRQREVLDLARAYRDRLHQPERAQGLLRDWLDEQRDHRISPTDAEGRVALAAQYESMLHDRDAAIELLRAAWKIDPGSKEVSAAFRSRGFRKENDHWVELPRSRAPGEPVAAARAPTPLSARLIGGTRREVLDRLGGKPDRVVRSASQNQMVEQWIYLGTQQNRYVNFLRTPGDLQPRVVAFYSILRSPRDFAQQPK